MSNALQVITPGSIAIATSDATAAKFPVLFRESGFTFFDLEKVTIPSGGGKFFQTEGLDGAKSEGTIECVITLLQANQRAYYSTKFGSGEKGPPNCSSTDGLIGMGERGVAGDALGKTYDCATCPRNQWNSKVHADGSQSKGKACREIMRLVVFRKDALMPTVIVAPPTSLKAVRTYMRQLITAGMSPWGVLTKIGLKVEKINGYDTAMLQCSVVARLDAAEAARMERLHDQLGPILAPFLRDALATAASDTSDEQPEADAEYEVHAEDDVARDADADLSGDEDR